MIKLTLTEKGGEPRVLTFDKDEITIGRVSGNDIVLAKGNVSKRHSRLTMRDGGIEVADLKSTNGTYVNGRKIAGPTAVAPVGSGLRRRLPDRHRRPGAGAGELGGLHSSASAAPATRAARAPAAGPAAAAAARARRLERRRGSRDDEDDVGRAARTRRSPGWRRARRAPGRRSAAAAPAAAAAAPTPLASRSLGLDDDEGVRRRRRRPTTERSASDDTGNVGLFAAHPARRRRRRRRGSRRGPTGNRPGRWPAAPWPPAPAFGGATGPVGDRRRRT